MKEIFAKGGMQNPNDALPYNPDLYGRKDGVNAPAIPFQQ
jgi:hypothetical protein